MTKLKLYQTTALAGLMVATISLWTAPAFAQTKDQATTTDDTVVVVTATRRNEKQLSIPYNISAVSGAAIDGAKVADNAELLRSVPGVSVVDRGYRNQGVSLT